MTTVLNQLENNSIYLILSSRGGDGFHWAIFVPTAKPTGNVWHAINNTGAWNIESKTTSGIPMSKALVLCYKIGTFSPHILDGAFKTTVEGVSGNGDPSPYTGEASSCRVWVKDVLEALKRANVIVLKKSVAEIEEEAIEAAEDNRAEVEQGMGGARVWNDTGASATA